MKKTFLHCCILSLLCFSMLFGLFACKNSNVPDGESNEPPTEEPSATGISFPKEGMDRFKIVYADGSSEAVISSADTLAKLIKISCKTEPIITNDFLREGSSTYCEYEYEILIGNTNREESQQFLETLRQDDFGYTCIGTKIVISGRDDYTVTKALDDFSEKIAMGKKSDEQFFCSEWTTVYAGTYAADNILLNGRPIADWCIVYPVRGSQFEKQLASKLQLAIADYSGYILPIATDSQQAEGRAEILIGMTSRTPADAAQSELCGYALGSDASVYLYGSSAVGNALAVNGFLSEIEQRTQNGSCTWELSARTTYEMDHEVTTAMSFNILTASMSSARTDRVIATVLRSLPDTLGVQEANPTWMRQLNEYLSPYYASVGTGTGGGANGEHVAIFYAKERYNLLESNTYWLTDTPEENSVMPGSEYPRVYTYALLEDRITGDRFLHLNVHLDTASSAVRYAEVMLIMEFLKAYNDVPVILSGDLNALADSPEMQALFANGFIQPVDALELTSYTPTFYLHNCNIDFVLVTNDSLRITDYVVEGDRINGDYASDHNAIYIRFVFRDLDQPLNHGWDEIQSGQPDEWLDVDKEHPGDSSLGDIHRAP